MIPQRIKLAGFLSYKDEQEVVFTAAPLWLLAGSNGSGKSSVFDAVTYALFGAHRGGTQLASELINKESSQFSVEFDFRLAGELIRAKRTLKRDAKGRTAGTQQLFRQTHDKWEAIEGTGLKDGFTSWIKEHIGLNYETFTSSVLLLQGKAEKLLDSQPKGRAEVLAQIVDLERYQKLHTRANDKKLGLKAKLEAVSQVQAAVPEVTEIEYAEAMLGAEAREDDQLLAQKVVRETQVVERDAERHAGAVARHAGAAARLAAAEALLGDAERIDELAGKLRDLQAALPVAKRALTDRADRATSEEKTANYTKQREDAAEKKRSAEYALAQAEKKKLAAAKQLAAAEGLLRAAQERLPEVSGLLEKVKQLDTTSSRLKAVEEEVARAGDPAPAAREAREEVERVGELNQVLPQLTLIQSERYDLISARKVVDEASPKVRDLIERGKKARDGADQAKQATSEAADSLAAARGRAAGAEALTKPARDALAQLAGSGDGATCLACGSPLTAKHRAAERARREQSLADAEATAASEAQVAAKAKVAHDAAQKREAAAAAQVNQLREEYADANGTLKEANATLTRTQTSLGLRRAQLSPHYLDRLALPASGDWAATTFPERDEISRFNQLVAGLPGLRERLRQADAKVAAANKLATQAETLRDSVAQLAHGLGGVEPAKLREEHKSLSIQKTSSEEEVGAARAVRDKLESESAKARADIHAAEQILVSLQGRLDIESHRRETLAKQEAQALAGLSPEWQARLKTAGMADHSRWQAEADVLARDGVPERARKLAEARTGLGGLAEEVERHLAECEAFPESARVSLEVAEAAARTARDRLAAADGELAAARHKLAALEKARAERARIGKELADLAGQFQRQSLLAELLGRDRLQRHLVRRAERQIVEYANGVLDRLSGGHLAIRLVGGEEGTETERALDLECCNRVTGGAPINVAFLSGSQKFRVAVSLALAIGQYASKQHRPIESVIIDEGFGCLDRQGRQVMIQEFQNLREHLRCILLVSHQEEFADAFPDGYRFEMDGGSTRVARFAR